MAAPVFTITSPDPTASNLGADLDKTRENIVNLAMFAASNGGRLPNWDSAYDYTSGDLDEVVLTYKPNTLIKIKITYTYSGGNLNKESYYYDKGLGSGYELLTNGVLTYGYTGDNLTSVTAGAS